MLLTFSCRLRTFTPRGIAPRRASWESVRTSRSGAPPDQGFIIKSGATRENAPTNRSRDRLAPYLLRILEPYPGTNPPVDTYYPELDHAIRVNSLW